MKKRISDFAKGFLLTSIPGIVAGVVSAGLTIATLVLDWRSKPSAYGFWCLAYDYWFIGFILVSPLCIISFIGTIWVGLASKTFNSAKARAGVGSGIIVTVVLFILSCLVNYLTA
jgi:hypothetical protein